MLSGLQKKIEQLDIDHGVVPEVQFSLKEKRRQKHTGQRDVLMISLAGLDNERKNKLKQLFDEERKSWISFPIKERSKHLMIRFGDNIFNFGYFPTPWFSKFRVWPSRIPSGPTIETVTPLESDEARKMRVYIDNITKHKRATIGRFDNEGWQKTKGRLTDNRTEQRGHNCTSWVATAPIGDNGESFMELLGASKDFNIATNPGWWSSWLLSSSQRETQAIYWDILPLKEMQKRIGPEGYFEWDFKRI